MFTARAPPPANSPPHHLLLSSPRRRRIADIHPLHLIRPDDHHSKIPARDRIMQIGHFLAESELLGVRFFGRGLPPHGGSPGVDSSTYPSSQGLRFRNAPSVPSPSSNPLPGLAACAPRLRCLRCEPAALLPLPAFHILRHHVRCTRDAPLRAVLPDPEHRLHGPTTAAALHLLRIRGVARAARENFGHFLHPHVGREGRHVGFVHRWVPWGVVVGIF